jgi:hypothetical protein
MVAQEKTTHDHQSEELYSPSVLEADEYDDFDLRPKLFARRRYFRIIAILLGITVLAGIGTGTCFALSRNNVSVRVEAQQPRTNSTVFDGISLEEFVMHNTADDCWHVIHGTVYDLTSYAPGKQEQVFRCWIVAVFFCFHSMPIR